MQALQNASQGEQPQGATDEAQNMSRSDLSERDKMMMGLPYLAMLDAGLVAERLRARHLLLKYNAFVPPTPPREHLPPLFDHRTNKDPTVDYFGPPERRQILAELFGLEGGAEEVKKLGLEIEPPFWCDYGTNIKFKGPFYCNFNCHFLDCAQASHDKITIGSRVLMAPLVSLYAGTHSVEVEERKAGLERAYPIEIGDDVWIGGGVSIIGPCKIGDGVTIAAGAVVRGDIPSYTVVGGVPARILKKLERPSEDPAA